MIQLGSQLVQPVLFELERGHSKVELQCSLHDRNIITMCIYTWTSNVKGIDSIDSLRLIR